MTHKRESERLPQCDGLDIAQSHGNGAVYATCRRRARVTLLVKPIGAGTPMQLLHACNRCWDVTRRMSGIYVMEASPIIPKEK